MPAPKKVTVEKIEEIIKKMKRMKKHQARKTKAGERPDGQPVYCYSSISKAMIAKSMGVNANYLTSLQKENSEIASALKYVGQKRASEKESSLYEPKVGTKAYLEIKAKRDSDKIVKLERQARESRSKLVHARKIEKAHEELLSQIDSMTNELKSTKKKNSELKSIISGLRMTNASMKAQIAVKD